MLRTPFILALALAVTGVGSAADTAEDKTATAIVNLGGLGTTDTGTELAREARVIARFETLTDAILAKLAKYPNIEATDASKCTDKGFHDLRELPRLQKLTLAGCPWTDRSMVEIGKMKALRHLYLGDSRLTDTGLAVVKNLTELVSLDLLNTKITDRGLLALKDHPSLTDLNLSGTKTTDAGLVTLKSIATLQTLKVVNTAVTAKGKTDLETALPKLIIR